MHVIPCLGARSLVPEMAKFGWELVSYEPHPTGPAGRSPRAGIRVPRREERRKEEWVGGSGLRTTGPGSCGSRPDGPASRARVFLWGIA